MTATHTRPGSTSEAIGPSLTRTACMTGGNDNRKVEMADEVLVVNVDGYVGERTRREIAHARSHGILVRFLEPGATTR